MKQFFIWIAIFFVTLFEVLLIVLTAVFRRAFWRKLFYKKRTRLKLSPFTNNSDGPVGRPLPQDGPIYHLTVHNRGTKSESVTLFGANTRLLMKNFGIPETVFISVGGDERGYSELMIESISCPFIAGGIRITSNNNNQLDENWTIEKRKATGHRQSNNLFIGDHFSAFQFQNSIRDITEEEIPITGRTSITFNILSDTVMQISLFVKKQFDIEDYLRKMLVKDKAVYEAPIHVSESEINSSRNIFRRIFSEIKEIWKEKVKWKKVRWLGDISILGDNPDFSEGGESLN